jgi:hypothetical protein
MFEINKTMDRMKEETQTKKAPMQSIGARLFLILVPVIGGIKSTLT